MKHTESQLEQAFISHCCDRGVIKIFETVGEDSMGEYSKGSKGELQFASTASTARTREIIKSLEYKIWQRNYYEHIIRDEKAYINISNYIIENPKRWINDEYNLSQ